MGGIFFKNLELYPPLQLGSGEYYQIITKAVLKKQFYINHASHLKNRTNAVNKSDIAGFIDNSNLNKNVKALATKVMVLKII